MLFNSYEFIFAFLPITFIIYFYLNHRKLTEVAKAFLVFSSLFFYSWWNILYLPLILGSMLFNYVLGGTLAKKRSPENENLKNKTLLTFGILINLSLLVYYKYADFFIENINYVVGSNIDSLNLLLPLAISFFTFQQIAYLIDSYKQETKEYDFLNYAIFVSFFPQLIAGPIVHHKEMMPQFAQLRTKIVNYRNIAAGVFVFAIGLFKKVVIADTFAVWANIGYDVADTLNFFEAWATSLAYTFQLYFDFSGYTDMAIGLALMFNIKLPINFNSPYKALDIQDFWRRWHMTLSRFMRDYIYIPLGGNRLGKSRGLVNLFMVALISGLWHGAGWTFVIWGAMHGFALVLHRIWNELGFKMNIFVAWFVTFNFANIAWVFFRAKEWGDAEKILSAMFDFQSIVLPTFDLEKTGLFSQYVYELGGLLSNIQGDATTPIWLVVGLFIAVYCNNSIELWKKFQPTIKNVLFVSLLMIISFGVLNEFSEFLYFNF